MSKMNSRPNSGKASDEYLLACIQKYALSAERFNAFVSGGENVGHTSDNGKKGMVVGDRSKSNVQDNQASKELRARGKTQEGTVHEVKPRRSFYRVAVKDKLFWCVLMIINKWDDDDLPEPKDRFEVESQEKTKWTELLQKTEDVPWKELKISRSGVCMALGSSTNGQITVDELKALAFLHSINIQLVWGKCFLRINGGRSLPSQANVWHVIRRTRQGEMLATDEHARHLVSISNEMYEVTDLSKPLMCIGSYKIGELQEAAAKLGVSTNIENGKPKLKKELYQEIWNEIQKID